MPLPAHQHEWEAYAARLVEQLGDARVEIARLRLTVDRLCSAIEGDHTEGCEAAHDYEISELEKRLSKEVAEFSAQCEEERGRALLALQELDRANGEIAQLKRNIADLANTMRSVR